MLKWNLEYFMVRDNLSIDETAKMTGLHRNAISKIKNNKQSRADLETIERICNGFGITIDQLIIKDRDA